MILQIENVVLNERTIPQQNAICEADAIQSWLISAIKFPTVDIPGQNTHQNKLLFLELFKRVAEVESNQQMGSELLKTEWPDL